MGPLVIGILATIALVFCCLCDLLILILILAGAQ